MNEPATCATCQYLTPAVPARPGVWEQRDGAMRFTEPQPAHDAYCGHDDDDVARMDCAEGPYDGGVLVLLAPDRFSCSRWQPR